MYNLIRNTIKLRPLCRPLSTKNVPLMENGDLDVEYLCDVKNIEEISSNITNRKGVGNINEVHALKQQLNNTPKDSPEYAVIQNKLCHELLRIPNRTHPDLKECSEDPKVVRTIGKEKSFDFKPREFYEITKRLNMARTDQLGNVTGHKSYYILGELAELEQALIRFSLDSLKKHNFELISVPDILERRIIEACGMNTTGDRTQVYSLENSTNPDLCLSGTSEMAMAGYLANKKIPVEKLPMKLTTVSRCFRAETSAIAEERGIYRVHQFTKVEMFAVSTPEQSENMLKEFLAIEEENFLSLGLHLRTLDMPPHELGAPAYRKFDVEAWLPGRKIFGEISSCSNCTDYQARRLGIKYVTENGEFFAHTLNGTACAIPRMLIALIETYQNDNGTIDIPDVLRKYMRGKVKMSKQKKVPELSLIKNKK